MKRLFDFLAAALGLIVLSPLLLTLAALIRWKMGAPVLFRQVRPGYKERPFTIYKFRTMHEVYDTEGNPVVDEERLTHLGSFLRKISVDELPELWNVVKGDMSLVGPRPLLMEYLPYYTKRERRRHEVLPGITGIAQISGRNLLPWDERLEIDVQYVEKANLALDLHILLVTVGKVIACRDIIIVPGEIERKLSHYRQKISVNAEARIP